MNKNRTWNLPQYLLHCTGMQSVYDLPLLMPLTKSKFSLNSTAENLMHYKGIMSHKKILQVHTVYFYGIQTVFDLAEISVQISLRI
jgi:hypothetical protein